MAAIDLSKLNEGQCAVVERLDEPLFVSAGAGSGKTFTLTARLVHALSRGSAADGGRYLSSVDEALVITFTDAAALEIKERVRQALREAGEEDPYLREEALKVDGAWISTIHGMCSRILHRYALELGLDPKFTVCTGSVADALYARALDTVMERVQNDDEFERLRANYAIWSGGKSVVGIVSTLRTEASKCVHGFDDLRCPSSAEAPQELERVERALQALACEKLTGKQREAVDASLASLAGFRSLAPSEQTAAAAVEALAGVKLPTMRKEELVALKNEAQQALAEAAVTAEYEKAQEFAPQLVAIAREVDELYMALKLSHSYLDNDDLIGLALRAVEEHPEVARAYAGRFRLVMIDEFQDTDAKQLRLISLLSGPDAQHLSTVGDAQQSIYRFRGGDVEVFRERGRSLPKQAHVAMDVNYRSDHHVLATVEHTCGDAGLLGDFLKLAGDAGRKSRYQAYDESGEELPRIRVELAMGGTADLRSAAMAAQLADRLAQWRDAGQPVGSMALLLGVTSRVNLYLDALRARGLPAVVTGGSSFSSTAEVQVVQALLHTLANPHDTQTGLFPLLSSDMFRLDADDFCQLGTQTQEQLDAPTKRPVEQCFVKGALELYGDAQPSERLLAAHAVLSRAFARMGSWRLADVCQAVIEESGWLGRLEAQGLDGLSKAANVLASVRYVRELTDNLQLGVASAAQEFDAWLGAAKLTPATLMGDEVDAVRVMTIHGSKGLQFAVTAVAECWGSSSAPGDLSVGRVDGHCLVCAAPQSQLKKYAEFRKLYPVPEDARKCHTVADWAYYLDAKWVSEEDAEKARLLYVALTRAEEALVVGVPWAEQDRYRSPLVEGFVGAFAELDELKAGECELAIAPMQPIECERRSAGPSGMKVERLPMEEEPGLARLVMLSREDKDSPWMANSADTLANFDGELPESVSAIPLRGTKAEGQQDKSLSEHFQLFEETQVDTVSYGWRAREDVFSYSSAHAADAADAQDAAGKRPPTPPKAEQDAEAEGSAYTDDADRATSLGSAFHELAQSMVECGGEHSPARLEALARYWKLSARQRLRLEEAIVRWERSELRREALSHEQVRAEVPFFLSTESRFGSYVEGAIDLLCWDPGSTEALLLDYKTGDMGLTLEQIRARHEMQANFYAWVLMSQGYTQLTCVFVCVERDRGDGEPISVRYHFDESTPPKMD